MHRTRVIRAHPESRIMVVTYRNRAILMGLLDPEKQGQSACNVSVINCNDSTQSVSKFSRNWYQH